MDAPPLRSARLEGEDFVVVEWRAAPDTSAERPIAGLHVHHEDDEAWHVLAGTLTFRFAGRTEEVGAGSTVFVPAGVAHTYSASPSARYLVVLTPRLRSLIVELQANRDRSADAEIYRRHRSELVETG